MCTLSVIPLRGGALRLAFNRDESPLRPAALPPQLRSCGDRRCLMPIDPASGGTWIALNDRGLIFALLNRTESGDVPIPGSLGSPGSPGSPGIPALHSRGLIIPTLAGASDLDDALQRSRSFPWNQYSPCRLVLLDARRYFVLTGDRVTQQGLNERPWLVASSGLGDHLVESPRRELFRQMVELDPTLERQDAFHRHRWSDRPHLSVNMVRDAVRTVSFTSLAMHRDFAQVRYHPAPPEEPADESSTRLELAGC